jgi:hypothetical protein
LPSSNICWAIACAGFDSALDFGCCFGGCGDCRVVGVALRCAIRGVDDRLGELKRPEKRPPEELNEETFLSDFAEGFIRT